MTASNITIWGAGIAGLIAANVFQTAKVFEKGQPTNGGHHKALLRFRSSAVGDACGIDFRKVRVHKGLWHSGAFVQPNILHANNYSRKVIGRLADRSVWDLEPVERYIAPPDFVEQLLARAAGRVQWGVDVVEMPRPAGPIISTIPMPVLADILSCCSIDGAMPTFKRSAITVRRWIVPDADVYQTVYVSDPSTPCYRTSITGNLLIAEYMPAASVDAASSWEFNPGHPFGLDVAALEQLPVVQQSYGKIAPIDDAWRKRFIFTASHEHHVFSLGRFGTWRNILLDDVLHDCAVIKRLIGASSYDRSNHMFK